jgi:hypothetical protein
MDRKLVSFILTNKLTRKEWANGSPTYQQFLTWRLTQTYDIYQAERNPNTQTPNLLSDISINLNHLQIAHQANYYFRQEVANTTLRLRVNNDLGDFFQVQQNLNYPNIVPTESSTGDRQESYILSAKKGISWLDFIGKLGYSVQPADYVNAWGYGLQVRLPGDCLYLGATHYKAVNKLPEYELSVNFAWDGNPRPSLDESVLSTFGF